MIPAIQKIETTGDVLLARFGHTMVSGKLFSLISDNSREGKNCSVRRRHWRYK